MALTNGELIEKLKKYPSELYVAFIGEGYDVYVDTVGQYVDVDGKLDNYISLDGRTWVKG